MESLCDGVFFLLFPNVSWIEFRIDIGAPAKQEAVFYLLSWYNFGLYSTTSNGVHTGKKIHTKKLPRFKSGTFLLHGTCLSLNSFPLPR